MRIPKTTQVFSGKYASPIEHPEYITPQTEKSGDRG